MWQNYSSKYCKTTSKNYEFGRKQGFNFNIGVLMSNMEIISHMKEELDVLSIFG